MSNQTDNDIDNYIREHLSGDSTYTSTSEKQRDFAHPAYKMNNSTGELFRDLVGQKILRTIHSGSHFPHVHDRTDTHQMAVANMNADGTIDAKKTDIFNPRGTPEQPEQQGGPRIVNGLPLIEVLPGGPVRVSVNRSTAIPKDDTRVSRKMKIDYPNGKKEE